MTRHSFPSTAKVHMIHDGLGVYRFIVRDPDGVVLYNSIDDNRGWLGEPSARKYGQLFAAEHGLEYAGYLNLNASTERAASHLPRRDVA